MNGMVYILLKLVTRCPQFIRLIHCTWSVNVNATNWASTTSLSLAAAVSCSACTCAKWADRCRDAIIMPFGFPEAPRPLWWVHLMQIHCISVGCKGILGQDNGVGEWDGSGSMAVEAVKVKWGDRATWMRQGIMSTNKRKYRWVLRWCTVNWVNT